jgi:adenylate cyclase
VVEAVWQSSRRKCLAFSAMALLACFPAAFFWAGDAMPFQELYPPLLQRLSSIAPLIVLGLVLLAAAEMLVWWGLGHCRPGSRPALEVWAPGVLVCLEALFPTILLGLAIPVLGREDAFASSITWFYFPVMVLAALNLRPRLCLLAGAAAALGFFGIAQLTLDHDQLLVASSLTSIGAPFLVKSLFLLCTGVVIAWVTQSLRQRLEQAVRHAEERDLAVNIFGQHVSPAVARKLLDQPLESRGENRTVAVLFLDIRGFSKYAAGHSPDEVMDYLNTLFDPLITEVNNHHGIVNKFLGDGFMAVFGAPVEDERPEVNAVRCATALLDATARLAREGVIPPTRLGIGVHVGGSVTGNVGAEARKEYTVIGDTVNIAARLEQATKEHSAELLVSQVVWEKLPLGEFTGEDLGEILLRGQPLPLRVFRLR